MHAIQQKCSNVFAKSSSMFGTEQVLWHCWLYKTTRRLRWKMAYCGILSAMAIFRQRTRRSIECEAVEL